MSWGISVASPANWSCSSYCAGRQHRDAAAVRLLCAAAAIRQRIGAPARQAERDRLDETLAHAKTRLGPNAFAKAWSDGRTMTLDAIVMAERSARY